MNKFIKHWYSRPILVLVILGTGMVVSSQAVRSHVKFEAEAGNLSGNVAIQADGTASGGSAVSFNQQAQACGSGQVGTPPDCVSASSALGITAGTVINPFDRKMKGIGLANWTFTKNWGKPFPNQIQGFSQAVNAIDPGIIRYAGGLWANSVGFDRTKTQQTAYTAWTYNGRTYYFNYGTDELRSVHDFATSVNAEVMVQVNMSHNDPAMWADLVRWAKEQGLTTFKYYEFSNELDLETMNNSGNAITPTEYANRLAAYQSAMLAVDPTIKLVGGVPATASDIMRNGYASGGNQVSQYITQAASAARGAGKDLNTASFHWYQAGGATTPNDIFNWSWGIPDTSGDWWRASYTREWSGKVTSWIRDKGLSAYPTMQVGVSELGVNSSDDMPINGNHVAALWYSDVLGRFAYDGADWITQWNSYAASNEYFSLLYPNSDATTTPVINARPSYYAYLMYSKYFGDQMLQSSSFDNTKLSVWASKDSKDPNKLKLRITNMTNAAINAPIALNGFTVTSGQSYTLSSTNPLDTSAASATSSAPTTINGVKINGSNVAASLASIQPTNVAVNGKSFSYSIPAYSSVALVLSGSY